MSSFRATAEELLEFSRVRDLLFGVYAWDEKGEEPYRVAEAGSGILIAKEHVLTARHVMQSFSKFDPQFEALARSTRGVFARNSSSDMLKSAIPAAVYQEKDDGDLAQWWPFISWQCEDTDLSVLVLRPLSLAAKKRARTAEYLEWELLPPRIGAKVRVYGFPQPRISIREGVHDGTVELWMKPARVTEQVPLMRAHGFQEFPGYVLDTQLPPGMSGGAVIYNGRLTGIFTGPDFVSALWPLAIMEYPVREGFFIQFAEHFDTGNIRALDWDKVRGRVERRACDRSDCLRKHVVLNC